MELWRNIRIYDEAAFDRKLSREPRLPLLEDFTPGVLSGGDLVGDQLADLIRGLGLPRRMEEVLRLKVEGYTLREIAATLELSRQRVERIWSGLLRRLPRTLEEMESRMLPGAVPHYGWQEVYLDSLRR